VALSPSYMVDDKMVDDKTVCRTRQTGEFCIGSIRLLAILIKKVIFEVRYGNGRTTTIHVPTCAQLPSRACHWALVNALRASPSSPKPLPKTPTRFFDNRFVKELEQSGFVKELYGQR